MEQDLVSSLRRYSLWLLVIALAGTAAELVLTGHFEGLTQPIPLGVIALCILVVAWQTFSQSSASLAAFRLTMAVSILSGVLGIYLHYQGKVEFQLESNPSLAGWALFEKAMKAKNPPILAPGMMIQMGLLGLIYAFRYPVRKTQ
jgi:hypothetical protein